MKSDRVSALVGNTSFHLQLNTVFPHSLKAKRAAVNRLIHVRVVVGERGDASIKINESPGRVLMGYRSKRILAHSIRE